MSTALEFSPEIILELGRGLGNSTCAFTEAANLLTPQKCHVISLCVTDAWDRETVPHLQRVVAESWFRPLVARQEDILSVDYPGTLAKGNRILIFWDAHGFEIAECVLGAILPEVADREHLVIMHDMSDARYIPASYSQYGEHGIWKGGNEGPSRLRIGVIDSAVEQAIAITDFAARNNLTLNSADHSNHAEFDHNPERLAEMRRLLGDELFSLQAHWFWFSLNEHPGPYTFPRFARPDQRES
jgi:hypothetical protein